MRQDRLPHACNAFWMMLFLLAFSACSKTRWSSLHLVPDADFLNGGQFVIDAEGYYFNDSLKKKAVINPTGLFDVGIMEWVNLEMGYAGGVTLGFKARLLGETGPYVPSLAIGARNIITNKEVHYFSSKDSTMANEFYLAFAKNIDPLKMRLHFGIQTIPGSSTEQINPFAAIEEYFGNGLYTTLEVEGRRHAFWPSMFGSWRILRKKLEISAGVVAINRMLFDKNNKFNFSLTSSDTAGFVRPGIWFGLRYCGSVNFGKKDVFSSVEDKLDRQKTSIEELRGEIDTLKRAIANHQRQMSQVDNSLSTLTDSVLSDKNRLRSVLLEKIVSLKSLYESEPFDPEQVRQAINQIVLLKENALPSLKDFVIDKKQDRHVRLLGISLIGDIGGTGASDILLDVLSQSEDPDIKIEVLIALGKMKETRAVYVMEQLANDPIDVVAFTAQEVLQKLVKEKGIKLSPELKMRPVSMPETTAIREEKIPVIKSSTRSPDAQVKTPQVQKARPDSALAIKTVSGASSAGKPATTVPAVDSAKAPSVKKAPMADSSKTPKNAQDDLWGVQSGDSSKAGTDQNVSSQIDTAGRKTVGGDTSAAANQSADLITGKKAPDKKSAKKEKPAKKPKENLSPPAPVDEKNW
jgi:HEAT repeats